jgi:streptogramin lyase
MTVSSMAAGPNRVWVYGSRGLVEIDPQTNQVVTVVRIPGFNEGPVAVTPSAVWVGAPSGELARLDPVTGEAVAILPVTSGKIQALAANGEAVWATDLSAGTVVKINAVTNIVEDRIELPCVSEDICFGSHMVIAYGSLWVSTFPDSLVRIDVVSDAILATIQRCGSHGGAALAASPSGIWAVGTDVARIDPGTYDVTVPIGLDYSQSDPAAQYGEGYVWLVAQMGGVLRQIDPTIGAVIGSPVDPFDGTGSYHRMTVGAGAVWESGSPGEAVVVRIRTVPVST